MSTDEPTSAPQTAVIATNINRSGYLVTHRRTDGSHRTYACADLSSLHALIYYLTGRTADTFPIDQTRGGVPSVGGLNIAEGLHIWGVSLGRPAMISGVEQAEIRTGDGVDL